MEDKQLYIVGVVNPKNYKEWAFQGIFDTHEEAEKECIDEWHFVGPCIINEKITREHVQWPGAYIPDHTGKEKVNGKSNH